MGIWSPWKNLDIGVELSYARDQLGHRQGIWKRQHAEMTTA
jgi:hypothetical protein